MTTPAEPGHLMRVLDLAQQLTSRGHRVLGHSAPSARDTIEAAGAEFTPFERYRDLIARMHAVYATSPRWAKEFPVPYMAWQFRRAVIDGAAELAREIEPILRRQEVDCVVYDIFSMGASYAAERVGIPSVSVGGAASVLDEAGIPMILRASPLGALARHAPQLVHRMLDRLVPLAQARDALGLPRRATRRSELLETFTSPELNITMVHRGFLPDITLRDRQVFAGPGTFDGARRAGNDVPFPPPRPGTVLVSTTTAGKDNGLLRTVLTAVAPMNVPVLATAANAPDGPSELGNNIRIERFVPHEQVFPHIAALITHGGWGTMGRALRHGVPMLIIPLFGDQHANAAQAAARGLAYHLPFADATPEAIRERLRRLLADEALRARVRDAAEEIQMLKRKAVAVEALERLALSRILGRRATTIAA
ncbi:glycosyltransferase [Sorangium cellulosum]|nr:glycosyltransferase [Sorangium cellulosum]